MQLDQQVMDQQSTLEKAGVPGFYVTNKPQDIRLQMYLLDFIVRLSHVEIPSWYEFLFSDTTFSDSDLDTNLTCYRDGLSQTAIGPNMKSTDLNGCKGITHTALQLVIWS